MGMFINKSPRAVKLYKLLFPNYCSMSPFCFLWTQKLKYFFTKINLLDCENNNPERGYLSF